jgi:thiol:disulfide interchange protein
MKNFLLVFALVLSANLVAFGQLASNASTKPARPPREKFDPARNPNDDLQAAIAKATAENKRIILDVGGEWCGWCISMDYFIEENAGLKKLRDENFVWMKVNMSEENENKEFLAKYPAIIGYPHLFVLEKDGSLLHSQNTADLEAKVSMIIPADVKDKEKARKELIEKANKLSYELPKFTEFLNKWSPEKTAEK